MTNKPTNDQEPNKGKDDSDEAVAATKETGKPEVPVSLPQPDTETPIKPKVDKDEAISKEAVAETYREKQVRAPLRFLALPPLYEIVNLSLRQYDDLAEKLRRDKTFQSLQTISSGESKPVLISLACNLLFAIVQSGGLIKGSPEEEILKLKINAIEAEFGFIQPVLETIHTVDAETSSEEQEADKIPVNKGYGLRRAIYSYGRLYLSTFTRYRVKVEKARDGDSLLPKLEITGDDFKAVRKALPWLENLDCRKGISWQKIFNHFLKTHCPDANWSNVAQVAAWRISERDRYPFLIAARRELYRSQAIPREKFKGILNFGDIAFQTTKKPAAEIYDPGVQLANVTDNDVQDFEAALDAASVMDDISGEKEKAPDNYAYVSRVLLDLSRSEKNKAKITAARILQDSKSSQIAGAGEEDLRNLLQWTAANLKDKEISTAHTYAVKVLRAMFSMPQTRFADWVTADVAEYLENYSTHASVTAVRNALSQFDQFLIGKGQAAEKHIKWLSHSLRAPIVYQARDVISNWEYRSVIEFARQSASKDITGEFVIQRDIAALTLLRRCGLRVGEAVHLTPGNFTGFRKWCLEIKISKTRAGIRKLPLYLLLDDEELFVLRQFVEAQKHNRSGMDSFLFTTDNGSEQLTAARLGRRIEDLLRGAGIIGESAHGLRHAFASSLFAAFWLNLTKLRRTEEKGVIYETLRKYARPAVEGRAATDLIYLEQLLGHADLRVSFERYVHLIEFALADSVRLFETDEANNQESLHKIKVAWLIGMDVEDLNRKLKLKAKDPVRVIDAARLATGDWRE